MRFFEVSGTGGGAEPFSPEPSHCHLTGEPVLETTRAMVGNGKAQDSTLHVLEALQGLGSKVLKRLNLRV